MQLYYLNISVNVLVICIPPFIGIMSFIEAYIHDSLHMYCYLNVSNETSNTELGLQRKTVMCYGYKII